MGEPGCPQWCMCRYRVYLDDAPNRCPESIDDERGTARCQMGIGHHGDHIMLWTLLNMVVGPLEG